MTILAATESATVHHCGWQELAEQIDSVDTLIVDAPYSARTHKGHHLGVKVHRDGSRRKEIVYPPWVASDVTKFVEAWAPKTTGWFCSLTDDSLAPVWREAFESVGRVAFAPIPCVEIGSRVRLSGDGPSSWTIWLIVARPKRKPYSTWGTLGGAYISEGGGFGRQLGEGDHDRARVIGGKTLWLMERIVQDYSRPNDLVCDPCCGGGTTLLAALKTGRRCVGADLLEEHARLSAGLLADKQKLWRAQHQTRMRQGRLPL